MLLIRIKALQIAQITTKSLSSAFLKFKKKQELKKKIKEIKLKKLLENNDIIREKKNSKYKID